MGNHGRGTLGVRDAAKIIYDTDQPTTSQMRRVEQRLERGLLKGARKGHWTTTRECVAEFMAARAYQQQLAGRGDERADDDEKATSDRLPSRPKRQFVRQHAPIGQLYREILKDYFLSLVFQRRRQRRSRRFKQAVIGGQLGCLLLLVAVSAESIRPFFSRPPTEHVVIERWIERHAQKFTLTKWYASEPNPRGGGVSVRVQYRYQTPNGKTIHTDRRFVVEGDRIVTMDFDE